MTTESKLADFLSAQNPVYDQVLRELTAGQKQTHWMWFIFPQLASLGSSPMSQRYGITSREEAQLYLQHPILGPRLRACTQLMLAIPRRDISTILGYPDDLKFRSCMTLFSLAAPSETIFQHALVKFFSGEPDAQTITILRDGARQPG